jgi:hypothetical protein
MSAALACHRYSAETYFDGGHWARYEIQAEPQPNPPKAAQLIHFGAGRTPGDFGRFTSDGVRTTRPAFGSSEYAASLGECGFGRLTAPGRLTPTAPAASGTGSASTTAPSPRTAEGVLRADSPAVWLIDYAAWATFATGSRPEARQRGC